MLKYSIVFKRRTYIMAGIFGKLFSEEQRELSALEKIADQVLKYEPEMQIFFQKHSQQLEKRHIV